MATARFYPNDCFVCKSTKNLRQCSRCQMISYCGEEHQKRHWDEHKEFCRVISDQLKSMKASHIYENVRGISGEKWTQERIKVLALLKSKLSRPYLCYETQMLLFPRTCFVCHEAKQQILSHCPNCVSVSFCPQHKDLRPHKKDCQDMKLCRNLDYDLDESEFKIIGITTMLLIERIFFPDNKSYNPPKSFKQLLIHYPKPPIETDEKYKIFASVNLAPALTVYNILCKLKLLSRRKIVVHSNSWREGEGFSFKIWEMILHLMPELHCLKIVFMNVQDEKEPVNVCYNCVQFGKKIEVKNVVIPYEKYKNSQDYEAPDVFVFHSLRSPPDLFKIKEEEIITPFCPLDTLSCPIAFVSSRDIAKIRESIKNNLPKIVVLYEGGNEYANLVPQRDCETEGINKLYSSIIIFQISKNIPQNLKGTVSEEKKETSSNGCDKKAIKSSTLQENSKSEIKVKQKERNGIGRTNVDKSDSQDKIEEKDNQTSKIEKKDNQVNKIQKRDNEQKSIISNEIKEKIQPSEKRENNIEQSRTEPNKLDKIDKSQDEAAKKLEGKDLKLKTNTLQSEVKETKVEQVGIKNEKEKKETEQNNLEGTASQEKKDPQSNNGVIDADWDFFRVDSCQVCHESVRCIPCTRCKMISYCGENHRKDHWPKHKDLCKIILQMLQEIGGISLFDKSKARDINSWLKIKIDFLIRAQTKIGRKLVSYEKQMFLFPRACFECHDSDSNILKTCDCGISLCRQHRKSPKHLSVCQDFQLAFTVDKFMQIIRRSPTPFSHLSKIVDGTIRWTRTQGKVFKLPASIEAFIDTNTHLPNQSPGEITKYRKQLFSELLSRPLTALYAIEKLNLMLSSSLVIHIIGANVEERLFINYWEVLYHWLPNLKSLSIYFIGPELRKLSLTKMNCDSCKSQGRDPACIYEIPMEYNEYLMKKNSTTPDIIFGFNLNLHESEYKIEECTWKKSIEALKKFKAPFVMTAGTEKRAKKDHEMLCSLLEKLVSHDFCRVNPFASLIMERDFETEVMKWSNKYILIYKQLYEEPKKTEKLKENLEVVPIKTQDVKSEKKTPINAVDEKSETKVQIKDKELKEEIVEKRDDTKIEKTSASVDKLKIVTPDEPSKIVDLVTKEKIQKNSDVNCSLSEEIKEFAKEIETIATFINEEPKIGEVDKKEIKQETGKKINVELAEIASKLCNVESTITVGGDSPLDDVNKLMKENELLKTFNEKLKKAIVTLTIENKRLISENNLIRDMRSEIKESIRLALDERKN